MTDFPDNIRFLDAASFEEEFEDVSVKGGEMEGGYSISRPRFTRSPRRTWSFRFVEMRDDSKALLEGHWKAVKGRSNIFQWTHPVSGETVNVRYGEMRLKFKRIGFGPLNLWESDPIIITEV